MMVCDLFFGPSKVPKMSARDSKLILDLFLDNAPVISTIDFNMVYDMFMADLDPMLLEQD
jgi:hypothetical protein